ncbi:DUF2914 domain-containing protein [Algicola sagamiensis]|uniref:DUF2914 domain-containing protein n=1 Tax=Algicola sagamiensis TaxID=163869 RepID=UPI0003704C12|nr:DUF2914 domain-containing protein [Algicola sagamiensis]
MTAVTFNSKASNSFIKTFGLISCLTVSMAAFADDSVASKNTTKEPDTKTQVSTKVSHAADIVTKTDVIPAVARSVLTTNIHAREPVDDLGHTVEADQGKEEKLYLFTDIRQMKGETVRHIWYFKGHPKAHVKFYIGGDRWRVYSSKRLTKTWLGDWHVDVVDSTGNVLHQHKFSYQKANG